MEPATATEAPVPMAAPATKIAQLSTAPAAKLARVFGAYAKTGEAA